jgi:hypothetical protein
MTIEFRIPRYLCATAIPYVTYATQVRRRGTIDARTYRSRLALIGVTLSVAAMTVVVVGWLKRMARGI